jgi:hypothetical protein
VTDKQRLNTLRRAREHLKKTVIGYHPTGGHWGEAMDLLDALDEDLSGAPPASAKVPLLGPVVAGGSSILAQDLTHETSGIPLYPAFDDGWIIGRSVIAPEGLVVTKQSSARGGDAFYATGESGIKYWFGHVGQTPLTGKKFRRGVEMAKISSDHPRPHVHVGINVEALIGSGEELAHHSNYTHGAPTVGAQLKLLLA